MMTLPKKLFYAVEAVLYIAYNSGHGPISSRDIAEKQGLPPRYLEQIMQRLVRAGVLRGVRGPRGGYLLAKERRRVTVGEVCRVLEDDEGEESRPCTPLGRLILEPICRTAHEATLRQMDEVSMSELCDQAMRQNIRKLAEERMDFAI